MDIPAAHNDAQGLSVMRSAPKLRPRTPMSGLVLPSCAQRRPWPAQAGTETCVHIPIQLIPIASLAWLGKQQPCPLLFFNFPLRNRGGHTHTHTHTKACRDTARKLPFHGSSSCPRPRSWSRCKLGNRRSNWAVEKKNIFNDFPIVFHEDFSMNFDVL